MKRIIISVALATSMLMTGVACSNENGSSLPKQQEIQNNENEQSYVDAIHWNGKTYLNNGNVVSGDLIGIKLGEITFRLEGSNKGSDYKLKDGEAVLLNPGTMVYQIHKSENVAVKGDEDWIVYELMNYNES